MANRFAGDAIRMTLSDHTASLEEVAAALGVRPAWLRRHHRRLAEEGGFPRRLAGPGWVWPRRLVAAWLAAGGHAASGAPAGAPSAANDDGPGRGGRLVAAQRDVLARRYGGRP